MAYAYSPGLKVLENTLIHRERRLPIAGEVLVEVGDVVTAEKVVMRTEMPGKADIINVVSMLGCLPNEITRYMEKDEGDIITKHDLLAQSKGFFGLFKTRIESPMDGVVENISTMTGQVTLRGEPIPVEVAAYIDGRIIDVVENERVTVETHGTFAQGIFGIGGERTGVITCVTETPDIPLTPEMITDDHADKILVGGSFLSYECFRRACDVGVCGIVVGGFDDADLKKILGYDLGVAITGHEDIPLTLIVTEGFGDIPMATKTYEILKAAHGRRASINGATQIRAGVMRPEVIVPHEEEAMPAAAEEDIRLILAEGAIVRIIREPYFGQLGKIAALPVELTKLPTESEARVLVVELASGERVTVPRANVEVMATD